MVDAPSHQDASSFTFPATLIPEKLFLQISPGIVKDKNSIQRFPVKQTNRVKKEFNNQDGCNFQLNCTLLIVLQAKIYIFSQISATRTLKPFLRPGVPLIRPRRLCELPDSCCTHRGLNGGGTQTHPFNFSKNDNNRSWKDCIPRLEV